jgi:hypothetical protein
MSRPPVQFLPLGTRGPALLGSRVCVFCGNLERRGEGRGGWMLVDRWVQRAGGSVLVGCCEAAWLGWVLTSYRITVGIVVAGYCYVGGVSRPYTRTISVQSRFSCGECSVCSSSKYTPYTGCIKRQGAFHSKSEIVCMDRWTCFSFVHA